MKVLFVNREMVMNPGGGATSELRFALALKKLGVSVKFLVGKPLFSRPAVPFHSAPVDYVSSPYLRGIYQKLPFPLNIPVGLLDLKFFSWACLKYLKRNDDYDVLHVLSIPQIVELKKFNSAPIVLRFPGPPSKIYDKDIQKADAVISDGDVWVQLKKHFRKDAVNVSIGVDSEMFKPSISLRAKVRKSLGIHSEPVIHYNGRFMPIKNVSLLISAMRYITDQMPSAKLVLVGDGPLRERLRAQVRKLGLQKNVIFVGRVHFSETSGYYAAADVFCMPSLYDNYPNSVVEAMSSGLPVVATNVGGIPLQVQDGKTGYLVESGDETALAEKILKLVNNPSKAKKMGLDGRHFAIKHFNWDVSAKKLKKLYELLLRSK